MDTNKASSARTELTPSLICTLSDTQRQDLELAWGDLSELSLSSEIVDGGTVSTYPLAVAAQVEDLANREGACCGSWLQATTERLDDVIRLEVTSANPEGVNVIRSFSGLDR